MIEEFRKNPPPPLAPKSFNIAQPFETELTNGLRVIVFENPRLPIINYRLAFRTGDINDPPDGDGLTSATAALLTQGTENYTSRALAEEVERLGASLNSGSSSDNTIVSASSLAVYGSQILKLMAEIVLRPVFPENELKLYKENTIKSLQFQRSQADFLADEQTARVVFGDHPYGAVAPAPADVERISRERLIEFHRATLIPNNALLIVVGEVDREKLLGELNELFGAWRRGEVKDIEFPAPPARTERTLTIVDRAGSAQANIVLANLGINRKNPDYFPIVVMNQILGAGASSRLFMNLREEKGYTYGAYASFDSRRLAGVFEATAEVRAGVAGDSLREFFYELEKIRNEKVADEELRDAKNFLTGVFPIRAETQEGLTNLIVAQKLYDLPGDYLQTYREKVAAVTAEDVQRVAVKYIHPETLAIVIVGDAAEILPQARDYAAAVEIYDTERHRQDIAKYAATDDAPPADINGKWNLTIDFQGQNIPVSFDLEQENREFKGNFESPFGAGKIAQGKVTGNKFKADVAMNLQGQAIDVLLNGNLEDDLIKGTLSAQTDGFPNLSFVGSRN